ncbi:hypothetical protein GZH47_13575 [Paenibacillus rhizovicinus]|uniref:Uncharacterized protein n=1 Tax=Paenibacillus rhizovicinus TaxID=2704463 RepID=A0A6C0NZX0_9BACL|nr:hypothetical protein [Paenibacillus rhizovicinus]QHW31767.1 hypothetical protein GZH47_13575 [Paenibacillus rhizovicinus]
MYRSLALTIMFLSWIFVLVKKAEKLRDLTQQVHTPDDTVYAVSVLVVVLVVGAVGMITAAGVSRNGR